MLSKYQLIRHLKEHPEEWDLTYDKETDGCFSLTTGERVCSFNTLLEVARKKLHCNFESIYYCHVSLDSVIRCKECGTVIFTGEDERYDPAMTCPICNRTGKCSGKYWTKEDIDSDPEKKKCIDFLIKAEAEARTHDKWASEQIKKQKDKWGFWIGENCFWFKRIKSKNHMVDFILEAWQRYHEKLKYLTLLIKVTNNNMDNDTYICPKCIKIPLTPWAVYQHIIMPIKFKLRQRKRKKQKVKNKRGKIHVW